MKRALLLLPVLLVVWLVIGFAWRLVQPADQAVRSQMVARAVPDFALPAMVPGVPPLSSADLKSGEPRLLNLFASWCVPCIAEAPVLEELERRGVPIDGIAIRDTPEAVAAFLQRHGNPYRHIGSDPASSVQLSLGSAGVPETFVVDGRGVIRFQYIGPIGRRDIPQLLQQLEAAR
jgi:cytochrome c biogenesis protein CcmG, thiol:disulfide interchange protein DsbE